MLESRPDARAAFREKADQLRVYSGSKFRLVSEAWPGDVVAVTGLSAAYPGQGLGAEPDAALPVLEPVLSYRLRLPAGADVHAALRALRTLEAEDPQLHVVWQENAGRSAPAADGRSAGWKFCSAYCRTVSASRPRLTKAAFCIRDADRRGGGFRPL